MAKFIDAQKLVKTLLPIGINVSCDYYKKMSVNIRSINRNDVI